jgi:hypothetical protein
MTQLYPRALGSKRRIFNNTLYVGHIHLKKAKPIHESQTHPLFKEDYGPRGHGSKLQGAWREDKLSGGKLPVAKSTDTDWVDSSSREKREAGSWG